MTTKPPTGGFLLGNRMNKAVLDPCCGSRMFWFDANDQRALVAEPHYGDDPERATRRAITRAAAEIGKEMP